MAGIFYLSSLSVLPGPPALVELPDWLQHSVAYGGLALIGLRAFAGGRWRGVTVAALVAAWGLCVAYGISDEFHQSFVPGRSPEVHDVTSDAAGAAIALGLARAWGMINRSSS
jgi:VanZ family protein